MKLWFPEPSVLIFPKMYFRCDSESDKLNEIFKSYEEGNQNEELCLFTLCSVHDVEYMILQGTYMMQHTL